MSLLRGVRRQAQPVECVSNSGKENKHGSVTLAFETECSVEDVEQALTLGLLRVGVQLGGFKKKPVRKGYITCQDMLEVLPFDEHGDHTDHHIDVRLLFAWL